MSNRVFLPLACSCLIGCGSLSVDHMFGNDSPDTGHAWHTWPAYAGMYAVALPLTLVSLPLILVEQMAGWDSVINGKTGSPGISGYVVLVPSFATGYVVAVPFFLVGLPWEFGSEAAASQPAARPDGE